MDLMLTIKKSLLYEYSQWFCLAIITILFLNWLRSKFLPLNTVIHETKTGMYTNGIIAIIYIHPYVHNYVSIITLQKN